jgi:peptidoglycan hydrolase-like protein with peptidoglycan-binding domain
MVRRAFPAKVLVSLALAFVLIGGVVAAGAVLREDGASTASADPATTTTSSTTTTTLPPTTTTTIPGPAQPPIAELPPVPYEGIGEGSQGDVVLAYEQRLADLKFDPGAVDGSYDQATVYALEAVQKILGFPRSGRLGPGEAQALATFTYPTPLHATAEPNRTEIDVTKQVITLYENYQVKLITTTSTASGETFCYVTPKKAPTARICEVATTPSGRFQYYFYYDGWHQGDLGGLYKPYYFFKGRAIHGYESVPAEPASHGCARIPMHIAEYWHTLVHDGDAVYVDGGSDGEQIISSTAV